MVLNFNIKYALFTYSCMFLYCDNVSISFSKAELHSNISYLYSAKYTI